ncbi:MAG: hypothetical protein MK082_04365 [Phycisphaerales bacterium]|nr:hypothetical protein [Phycisphaerales bacterium]
MTKQLARPRPGRKSDSDRTKVVFVRQPVKQVAQEADRDHLLRCIVLTCFLALALTAVLAALGAIGGTLGFEDGLGLPRRATDVPSAFVEGIAMVSAMPSSILRSGEDMILLPLLGPFFVGVPAALLALARPRVPGAPLPDAGSRALATTGAVFAMAIAVAGIIWSVLAWRVDVVSALPAIPAELGDWRERLELISGIDVFAFLSLVLWSILAFRLGLPRWGRALTCTTLLVATAVVFVSMSISSGLLHGLDVRRPAVKETGQALIGGVGDLPVLVEFKVLGAPVSHVHLDVALASDDVEFRGTTTLSEGLARIASSP